MDDILPGMIINGVLGVDLIDTSEFRAQLDDIILYHGNNPEAVRRRKKRDVCICTCSKGSPHTSQISHLIVYPSLWLLVPGLSSQYLSLFPIQVAFDVSSGQQYL